MNDKYILITNPLSGSYNNKKITKIISRLENFGIKITRIDLKKEQRIDEVIETLDSSKVQNLILAFGDGTINSACNALLNRDDCDKFIISILPMGTANILSLELNCDTIQKSLEAICSNNIKSISPLIVNNLKYFVLMASAGFDSYTVYNINEKLKDKIGKLAYVYEFLKICLKRKFKKLKTTVDGINYENILTCVSNGKYYGTNVKVTDCDIFSNSIDVLIVKKFNIYSMIKYFFTKKSNKNVVYLRNVDLIEMNSSENSYPFQIDGDYFCDLPVKITKTGKRLKFKCCVG